ncbi:MAG: hypothetical protein WA231_25220 [Methylocella sp.]
MSDRGASHDRSSGYRLSRFLARMEIRLAGLARENLRRCFPIGQAQRKRLACGDAAAPASTEMAPGAKGLEEGKAVSTNAVNHVIDLARTYL